MIKEIREALPGCGARKKGKEFELREGICFGMSPGKVVWTEKSRGLLPRETGPDGKKGPLVFSGMDFCLYYGAEGMNLGGLPLFLFEYDFSMVKQRLYQFSYLFRKGDKSVFFPLSMALQAEYGPPNNHTGRRTVRYTLVLEKNIQDCRRWMIPFGEDRKILIDLWLEKDDTCKLAYEMPG